VTGIVIANFPIIALIVAAMVGVPLWITFKHPHGQPDYSEARAHFQAKGAAEAHTSDFVPTTKVAAFDGLTVARQRPASAKGVVFLVGSRLMTVYLWHLPVIIILVGAALLIPGASPEAASAAWWLSRPLVYVLVLAALFGLSFLVGRWETPGEVGVTPPAWIVGLAAVLIFVPAVLILQWFLNLEFAIIGAVFYGAAVLLLGRWRSRSD